MTFTVHEIFESGKYSGPIYSAQTRNEACEHAHKIASELWAYAVIGPDEREIEIGSVNEDFRW